VLIFSSFSFLFSFSWWQRLCTAIKIRGVVKWHKPTIACWPSVDERVRGTSPFLYLYLFIYLINYTPARSLFL
jgi:hypothetical protein